MSLARDLGWSSPSVLANLDAKLQRTVASNSSWRSASEFPFGWHERISHKLTLPGH